MENNIYPKMDRSNRAKQFMPFDALKGFREALLEKEKLIVSRRELSEEQTEELNFKLHQLYKGAVISVEYYNNGEYLQIAGMVSEIDERGIKIVNTWIPLEDISDFTGDIL